MQSRAGSSAFLSRPEQILPFIDYALLGRPSENSHNLERIGEGPMPTLRIVEEDDGGDDDARGDMMRTAVNLLLSLFEGVERSTWMNDALMAPGFSLQLTRSLTLPQPPRQLRESRHNLASWQFTSLRHFVKLLAKPGWF